MKLSYPRYYNTFRCLAGACPDSCCKEWAVAVDEASARIYCQLPGELGDALREAMCLEDGDVILALTPDNRCPMWRDDGLCRIQAELGETALCDTCTQFPRLRHEYGDFTELGLELSCPEAARLILSDANWDTVSTQAPGCQDAEYDTEAMTVLLRSRCTLLDFLCSGGYPTGQALAITLLYAYAVQNQLDGGDEAHLCPAEDLHRARQLARPGDPRELLSVFRRLEILTPRWRSLLDTPQGSAWSPALRAMARYMVERYWLQAVSDYDLVGRVKYIIASCLAVKLLGGEPSHTAQLFSKEVENNYDNVEALLDAAYTSPALADIGLLGLLLEE